ncbi:hypothetical protein [uncultured Lacinutrix sp.]|uniref:tetratricopeptide repeat protein n=1 Tax=uncultured Lacinutrix sp. TaxID=574032 RepID=UPI002610BB5A|nr:hypothetical protein [uncultured Lacinutrix sp.]
MRKLLLCVVLFFLAKHICFANETTAVNSISKSDSIQNQRVKIIDDLSKSKLFTKKRMQDSALFYANRAIRFSIEYNLLEEELLSANQKGLVYLAFRNFDEATSLFENVLERSTSIDRCELYHNIGVTKNNAGQKRMAIEFYLKAKDCFSSSNTSDRGSMVLYSLGWLFMDLKQYDKASKYYLEGLSNLGSDTLRKNKARIYRGLGVNASRKGNYNVAIEYSKKALTIFELENDNIMVFDVLNNISANYLRMTEYKNALDYSNYALAKAFQIKDSLAISASKINKISALIGLKRFNKAFIVLKEIEKDTVRDYFVPQLKVEFYRNMALINSDAGNYKNAFLSQKRFKEYSDSIVSKNQTLDIIELENEYQFEKSKNQILNQKNKIIEQEIKLKNKTILILIISLISIILISVVGYKFYREREKQQLRRVLSLKFQNGFNEYLIAKYDLSKQQLDLWLKITEGLEENEIAQIFFKSPETINRWRRKLYVKLNTIEKTEKHYTKAKAIILYNKELSLYKELIK